MAAGVLKSIIDTVLAINEGTFIDCEPFIEGVG
jgi:hypothetical protein